MRNTATTPSQKPQTSLRWLLKTIASMAICALIGAYAARAEVASYDLSRNFSIASNPNGVWSYGWETTLGGSFTLLGVARSYLNVGIPFQDWVLADNQHPVVMKNASSDLTFDDGQHYFPPGTVSMLAGFDGWPQNFCVSRFTTPTNGGGAYLLENVVESRRYGTASRDTDFYILVNGVELFSTNMPPNARVNYTNTLNLNAGDTVDFATGRGFSGVTFNSGVKLQCKLSHSAICTPRKATARAQVVNGFVVGATLADSGCGYTNAPIVLVQGGGGTGATARSVISDGRVTGIQIISAGCCYTSTPRIVISAPPMVPTVEIVVSKVKVVQNVVLGWKYVLESSTNSVDWAETGPAFVADTDPVETEFDVEVVRRFYRLKMVP